MIPGVFQRTIFTRQRKINPASLFIRPMHPKTEIRPTAESIRKILDAGWIGQLKIHGHRAQIHIPADPNEEIIAYNRHGQLHKKEIPDSILNELRRIFAPTEGWNVLDCEWIKPKDRVYVFDFIKNKNELLHRMSFQERWKLLPRAYISPVIQTLGILSQLDTCLEALNRPEDWIEGLVFKSPSPGFEDSSIIRCRKS